MTTTYKEFRITSTYKGDKKADWGNDVANWNRHIITVTNIATNLYTKFEFWSSIARPVIETDYDLLNAFYCFVGDAISGNMNFAEFCSEFGFDEDSRKAERIWKACRHSMEKLTRIYDGDIYDLCNDLAEIAA